MWDFAYNALALPLLRAGARLLAPFSPKVREGLVGRRGVFDRLEAAVPRLLPSRPRIWVHASSAGELLQARPLLDALRKAHPQAALILTIFSPSAERLAHATTCADLVTYLPEDTRANARRLYGTLQPRLVLFAKWDLWPNIVWEGRRRGVPVILFSATLAPTSRRLWPVARGFHSSVHGALSLVCAIAAEDAERFAACGVPRERLAVTGDTRYDQTWARAQSFSQDDPLLKELDLPPPVWVAGSTWPADEEHLLPAFARLRRAHPGLRLLLVPHEPTEARCRAIEGSLRRFHLEGARLSAILSGTSPAAEPHLPIGTSPPTTGPCASGDAARRWPPVVVVDRVGVLAGLYALAAIAYVGGGFGGGLHSVLEPACLARPIIVGPRWQGSREAGLLLQRGAAVSVRKAEEMEGAARRLLADPTVGKEAGARALALVTENLGATDRILREIQSRFAFEA